MSSYMDDESDMDDDVVDVGDGSIKNGRHKNIPNDSLVQYALSVPAITQCFFDFSNAIPYRRSRCCNSGLARTFMCCRYTQYSCRKSVSSNSDGGKMAED